MRPALLYTICCVILISGASNAYKHGAYEGYKVLGITCVNEEDVTILHQLARNRHLDFWTDVNRPGSEVIVMAAPKVYDWLIDILNSNQISYKIVEENIQRQVDLEKATLEGIAKNHGKSFNYNSFNRYESIMEELEVMKTRCPTGVTCDIYSIGKSIQGKDLTVFKISKPGTGRKGVWMDSLIHAREWIAGTTVLKIMDNIVTNYGVDTTVTELVDRYDWYFLPVMNPDGYSNSWQGERLWRKNMRPPTSSDLYQCWGVDLNRNYDAYWMNDGTADWQCLDNYGGTRAASEPETLAVQNEAVRLGDSLMTWVSVHSFSNLWLTPWGHTDSQWECVVPDDNEDLGAVAQAAATATAATHGTSWTAGTVCQVLYAASGSTADFVKATARVKYTFTPELRGESFIISPAEIQPSFEEIWNGVKALVREIESRS